MRDLVLAQQYPNATIAFACQELAGNIIDKISYPIHVLGSNDPKELISLIHSLKIDRVIFDHYDINYDYEKELKETTGVEIFVLDDTYEKHHCDILLNHNISANKKKYKNLVPKSCEIRCGSKYTLLRDEFIEEKKKKTKVKNNKVKTVFVAMGGADHSNINIKILKVLEKFDNLKVNLVTTTANKNLEELQEYVKEIKWINLHVNSNKIAKLMNKSDFAIVTPSVTLNEVCFMKLPFIAIKTAKNQEEMHKYLKKKKYYDVLKRFSHKKLKSALEWHII